MKAFGRVRIHQKVRLALPSRSSSIESQREAHGELKMFVTSDAFRALLIWADVINFLWSARRGCRDGAQFEFRLNYVRKSAERMRSAIFSGDWQHALLRGVEAQNAILRLENEILGSIAGLYPKRVDLSARVIFQRELRLVRARIIRQHHRNMTHDEAEQWAGKSGLVPDKIADRTLKGWIAAILGPPPRGPRPGKKK